jgi:putative two-component system response regulator
MGLERHMSCFRHLGVQARGESADSYVGVSNASMGVVTRLMSSADLPHVLVVGEDTHLTLSICEALGTQRFRCSEAIGSREALAVARRTCVDVALLDVTGLRPQDSLQLAQRLRDESRDLGVVLIAANRSLEDLVDALRVGVVDFLSKPISHLELADAVGRAMEWREAVQLSRGSLAQQEEDMADGGAKIGALLMEWGIASSAMLDACLARLYGDDHAALEHSRRVASMTLTLCQWLDIADPLLGHIERAAMLHDVGRLAIPKAIVRKGWPLSFGEDAVVRSHVRVAAELLARVPFLEPTADIVGATRERYDGRGCPDRRRGAAIPIGARVIAVAEAFDTLSGGALTSSPQSTAAANAVLVRHAGSRFDPKVVHAWLRCLDDAEAKRLLP